MNKFNRNAGNMRLCTVSDLIEELRTMEQTAPVVSSLLTADIAASHVRECGMTPGPACDQIVRDSMKGFSELDNYSWESRLYDEVRKAIRAYATASLPKPRKPRPPKNLGKIVIFKGEKYEAVLGSCNNHSGPQCAFAKLAPLAGTSCPCPQAMALCGTKLMFKKAE